MSEFLEFKESEIADDLALLVAKGAFVTGANDELHDIIDYADVVIDRVNDKLDEVEPSDEDALLAAMRVIKHFSNNEKVDEFADEVIKSIEDDGKLGFFERISAAAKGLKALKNTD